MISRYYSVSGEIPVDWITALSISITDVRVLDLSALGKACISSNHHIPPSFVALALNRSNGICNPSSIHVLDVPVIISRLMRGVVKTFRERLTSGRLPPTSVTRSAIVRPVARGLANVRDAEGLSLGVWFNNTPRPSLPAPSPGPPQDHKPPDERTLKLGKSMAPCGLLTR